MAAHHTNTNDFSSLTVKPRIEHAQECSYGTYGAIFMDVKLPPKDHTPISEQTFESTINLYNFSPPSNSPTISFTNNQKRIAELTGQIFNLEASENYPKFVLTTPSKSVSMKLISSLVNASFEPKRISISDFDSICLAFSKGNFWLYLEIYSDGTMGYISEDASKKQILDNQDVNDINSLISYMKMHLL